MRLFASSRRFPVIPAHEKMVATILAVVKVAFGGGALTGMEVA